MHVCVVGAGSLGSLVGAILAREHRVTLVGRSDHVEAIRTNGLAVRGKLDFRVRPDARTDPPASADLALVTVKSYDTHAAARALATCDLGGVLSLQNGLGNERRLAEALSTQVLAGTCTYGARRTGPGAVACTGLGEVVLGPHRGGSDPFAETVGEAFAAAGLEVTVAPDMPSRLWEKLAVNAAINPTTALARVKNGALVTGPGWKTAEAAARETARVARAAGVDIESTDAVEAARSVAEATAENTSSMYQDVLAGRRTEIDAINGAVVDRATEPVPVNQTLTALVRAWEREQGLRPDPPEG